MGARRVRRDGRLRPDPCRFPHRTRSDARCPLCVALGHARQAARVRRRRPAGSPRMRSRRPDAFAFRLHRGNRGVLAGEGRGHRCTRFTLQVRAGAAHAPRGTLAPLSARPPTRRSLPGVARMSHRYPDGRGIGGSRPGAGSSRCRPRLHRGHRRRRYGIRPAPGQGSDGPRSGARFRTRRCLPVASGTHSGGIETLAGLRSGRRGLLSGNCWSNAPLSPPHSPTRSGASCPTLRKAAIPKPSA